MRNRMLARVGIVLLLLHPVAASAQSCEDYSHHVGWLAREALAGLGNGVVVLGDYAYVAEESPAALTVLDVTNPDDPSFVGSASVPGVPLGVDASGGYAFVAARDSGLQVVDVTTPSAPVRVASRDTPGQAQSVAISGSHAFVADGPTGLQVISVSDPLAPVIVGSLDTPGSALDIAVEGDLAYVADGSGGLRIIDVQDPTMPVEVGFLDPPDVFERVAVSGSYAYASNQGNAFVIDVANPAAPAVVGSTNDVGTDGFTSVAVDGDRLYVGMFVTGLLRIFDVSNPAMPALLGAVGGQSAANDVFVAPPHVYVVDESRGFHVIDATYPASPGVIGQQMIPSPTSRGIGVDLSGDLALMGSFSGFTSGVAVLDISDPTDPVLLGNRTLSGVLDVTAVGTSHMYVSRGTQMVVVDISIPSSLQFVDTLVMPGDVNDDLALSGDRAFAASEAAGLTVIDVSVPASPAIVGSADTPDSAYAVEIAGDFAYVADGASGLQVFDISTPDAPVLVGSAATPMIVRSLSVSGDLCVAGGGAATRSFSVIDISTPAAPALLATRDVLANFVMDVHLVGNVLYVANISAGTLVYDLSDPSDPLVLGGIDLYFARDLDAAGDLVFVADDRSGLSIIPAQCVATGVASSPWPGDPTRAPIIAWPNPSRGEVSLSWGLEHAGRVRLDVFDVSGRLVRRLIDGELARGAHGLRWAGDDEDGHAVADGVYLLRLESSAGMHAGRLTVVR